MSDTYFIKIESAVISSELITDLANRIEEIHNNLKNPFSYKVDYILKKKSMPENSVHTKEEFLNLRIPKNLEKVSMKFYTDHKRLEVSLNIGYVSLDSKIEASSDDKIWNRGVVLLLNEIIEENEKKFNKWIRKRSSKVIVGVLIGVSLYFFYSLLLEDSGVTDSLWTFNIVNSLWTFNIVGWFYVYPTVFSVWMLSFLFPSIEHSKMWRVRIRKYLVLTLVPLIVFGLLVNGLYDLIKSSLVL